jgi:transcriptional regulator of aromatic amino acid metabolism
MVETAGRWDMGHEVPRLSSVEEDVPVAARCVLKKWSFPARADRPDVPAALPVLSPLQWKGEVRQVVG